VTELYRRRWQALVVLCFGLAVVGMDSLIVNVTLPSLVRELQATTSQLQWTVDAYTLAFAGSLLTMGALGDRYGRRRTLYLGLLIFAAGSLAAAEAGSAGTLIAARAVMGLGGAVVCPSTLSIITNIFPEHERGKAIGIWSSFSVLGIVIGPTVGGWLLDRYWWGSVFLINIPIVAVVVVATWLLVPESRDPHAPAVDWLGAAMSLTGLVTLVHAIIEAPGQGWTGPATLGQFAAAALLLAAFITWERRRQHPLLPVTLFRNRRFTAANATLTLMFFAINGLLFLVTQHLQFVLGYSPLQAGVRLLPVTTMILTAVLSATLVHRFGTTAVVTTGLLVEAGGGWLLHTADTTNGYGPIALALALFGLGMGLAQAPATDSIMGALPLAKAGVGSAMNDTTRAVGGALGVAVLGSVLTSAYTSGLGPALAGLPAPVAAAARSSVGGALQAAGQLGAGGSGLEGAARRAFVDGSSNGLLVATGMLMLGALVALVLLPAHAKAPHPAAASDPATTETADTH